MRGRDVISHILGFTHPKREVEWMVVEVVSLIEDGLRRLAPIMSPKVTVRWAPVEPSPRVTGDPERLRRMLVHLLTNALHATEADGGVIEVEMAVEEIGAPDEGLRGRMAPGFHVRITVSDDGHGIPDHVISRIFDPYFTTKKFGKGMGVGLPTVLGIVESHGGTIAVGKREGGGTRASVWLPLAAEPGENGGKEIHPQTERLLFVDDDPATAEMTRRKLVMLGYRVLVETDPKAALAKFSELPKSIDMVITDMDMPGMNGDELMRRIRAVRPDIPVLLCTGYSDSSDSFDLRDCGATDCLRKPVELREWAETIRAALRKKPRE